MLTREQQARAIEGDPVAAAIHAQTEAEMHQKLLGMGAINLDDPLPRSKYIKVLDTGRVFPWNELLASQPRKFVACCDVNGNTDEAAWAGDVEPDENGAIDNEAIAMQARISAMQRASDKAFAQPGTPDIAKENPDPYPPGVVSYKDVDELLAKLI